MQLIADHHPLTSALAAEHLRGGEEREAAESPKRAGARGRIASTILQGGRLMRSKKLWSLVTIGLLMLVASPHGWAQGIGLEDQLSDVSP